MQILGVSVLLITFLKFVCSTILSLLLLKKMGMGVNHSIDNKEKAIYVSLRSFFGLFAFTLLLFAPYLIPITISTMISSMNVFFGTLVGYFVFRDPITCSFIVLMLVSYVGVGFCII